MERVIIAALADCGIEAGMIEGLTGVWTAERRKIASIGVHVNRGVTTHGFAINVNNDLQPFEWIVPCGIEHAGCPRSRASSAPSRTWMRSRTPSASFGERLRAAPVEVGADELAVTSGIGALPEGCGATVGAVRRETTPTSAST